MTVILMAAEYVVKSVRAKPADGQLARRQPLTADLSVSLAVAAQLLPYTQSCPNCRITADLSVSLAVAAQLLPLHAMVAELQDDG